MASDQELETWRREIKEIDAEILRQVKRRMELALNIGNYKKKHQLPVKDFKVEKQVIEKARDAAKNLGLYPILAEELMTTLIKYSVLRQDELTREGIAPPLDPKREALIIGGAGLMGRWFAQYYESMGFAVSIYDKQPQTGASEYRTHPRLEEGIDRFQLILLATPMQETNTLLLQLADLPVKGLIVEICSLKSPVLSGIKKLREAGLKIASIHPMFGPDTDILAGKNIVFCTAPGLFSEEILQQHFQQTSAQLLLLPLDEHDQLMSYILGASHLINLIYAQVLSRSGHTMGQLKQFGGTTFLKQLEVSSRVVAENQALYFDIQSLNKASPQLIKVLSEALATFSEVIAKGDKQKFQQIMEGAARYFQEAESKQR